MNYYEYAPFAFRWLSLTPIKPWHMFAFLWIAFGLLTLKLFFIQRKLKKTQPEKRKTRFFIGLCAWIMLFNIPILDMYYMNSEFNNALARPGIWIKRQVEANGYAEDPSSPNLTDSEIKSLNKLPALGDENYWESVENKDCTDNINKHGYEYKERFRLTREKESWIQSNPLRFYTKFGYLGENQDLRHLFVSKYDGLKDGQCVYGLLKKPSSRYWVVNEDSERIGYGLFILRTRIIDTWTGEEIAYSYTFQKSGNFLLRITAGLLGNTHKTGGNSRISMPNGEQFKIYKVPPEHHTVISLTLIPTKYYRNQ